MSKDYTRDQYGMRFPAKDRDILERLEMLASYIHSSLIEQDNLIPNESLLEGALENIAEVQHLIKRLTE